MNIFLITAYEPPTGQRLAFQLDDRWFHPLPREPFEVASAFDRDKLIDIYGPIYGLIEVPTERTRTGIVFDPDGAVILAQKELDRVEGMMLANYVKDQQENRIRHNFPALPPTGRVGEVVERRKIDLQKTYNLTIHGATLPVDEEKAAIKAENDLLKRTLAAIESRLSAMESAATEPASDTKKGK